MRRHFQYIWSQTYTFDDTDEELLGQLSTSLRQEVMRIMYSSVTSALQIFTYSDDANFQDDLLALMRPTIFSPHEILCTQGKQPHVSHVSPHLPRCLVSFPVS